MFRSTLALRKIPTHGAQRAQLAQRVQRARRARLLKYPIAQEPQRHNSVRHNSVLVGALIGFPIGWFVLPKLFPKANACMDNFMENIVIDLIRPNPLGNRLSKEYKESKRD